MLLEENERSIFLIKNKSTNSRAKCKDTWAYFMNEYHHVCNFHELKIGSKEQDLDVLIKNSAEEIFKKIKKFRYRELYLNKNWPRLEKLISNGK